MIVIRVARAATRPPLTREQVLENADTYKSQVFKILDPRKPEVAFNSTWNGQDGACGLHSPDFPVHRCSA